ncbi:MAG: hypothetical protein [Bacteriophage sp.]|nr:MAG: hypothetical protein [Bacteriophage sp.]
MKFLDLNGLTHFFGKVKTWIGNNYLSLKGGTIDGSVTLLDSLSVREQDSHTQRYVTIEYSNISMGYHYDDNNKDIDAVSINPNYISAPQFKKSGGTSTQVLMANGSVKEIGRANGVAGLDANGNVPLAQLGNLDTTVAEVVTALPTTNIKKHIYLIKDASGVSQNQYEEYIYTGDTSATYDASKWEKLGDFRATVDLADYAKKNKAANELNITPHESQVNFTLLDIDGGEIRDTVLGQATSTQAGVMISSDKKKLDGIANNANNYSLPTASSTIKGGITLGYSQNGKNYPVVLDTNGKAYVNVPWIDTNTTYDLSPYAKKVDTVNFSSIRLNKLPNNTSHGPIYKQIISFNSLGSNESVNIELEEAAYNTPGLMSVKDKNKLDSISSGATADSAITTAEIDALFA